MIAALAIFTLNFILTGIYRMFALRGGWLDHPNQRSSHTEITPRGAGIVFAIFIIGLALFALNSQHSLRNALMCGVPVIALGWWDDIRGLTIKIRFCGYALAAAAAVFMLYGFKLSEIAILLMASAALLWLINLYNFMDGINGIAAGEAAFILLSVSFLSPGFAAGSEMAIFIPGACSAIVAFLVWNFPIGRVFMGDAGSAFLGFLVGVLMLSSAQWGGPMPTTWLIVLGVFICDSGYTLIYRAATRQRWYTAHRLHAYQKLTKRLNSHFKTVFVIMAVNILWLLPWAWVGEHRLMSSWLAIGMAYLPLLVAVRALKAGQLE